MNNQFFECEPNKPLWKREQLNHEIVTEIRNWISERIFENSEVHSEVLNLEDKIFIVAVKRIRI